MIAFTISFSFSSTLIFICYILVQGKQINIYVIIIETVQMIELVVSYE